MLPPRETLPPPVIPVPALTVTDELVRAELGTLETLRALPVIERPVPVMSEI